MNSIDVELIIDKIRKIYTEKYQRDAIMFFMNGGCFAFALILKSIFDCAIIYDDGQHVITKIGDDFYDVRGIYLYGLNNYKQSNEEFCELTLYPSGFKGEEYNEIIKTMVKEYKNV